MLERECRSHECPLAFEYSPEQKSNGLLNEISTNCACRPVSQARQCCCRSSANRWAKRAERQLPGQAHTAPLIAYLRAGGDPALSDQQCKEQLQLIETYCQEHGYHIARAFEDRGKPATGLQEALSTLDEADGLIAVNLNRFVEHLGDRLHDIRPFLHHFFCHTHKHLITIEDGVDTRLPAGQLVAFELIHDLQDQYQL